ncbi:major facilitator superfamily domain-containing protein [Naematelia encephala]|uniref:Major facilitator superfamily domain-containing protein n=1 Tax=Naematelia encephala TaxID=71784 RepID=A0A1Y2BAQ0_9TREE|nr:major facilitator superfamily domain-containing protein [Naematelia encephala]
MTSIPDTSSSESRHYNLAGLSQKDFWILCMSMWSCSFLSAFDGTIVATLLGPISSSFLAANLASWLGTAYLLSVCCFTPIYGRLCNIIGRQAAMLIALGFFTLGNVMCAVAPSMHFLVAARAIAGIGGGGLTSVGSTIMSDLVPITHRGIFQGYANIAFGFGAGLGPPLGGLMSDGLGWRWAFFLQIPLLLLSAVLIYFKVRYTTNELSTSDSVDPIVTARRQTAREKLSRIDFLGCFLLAGFVGSSLFAVSLKTNSTSADACKWSDPVISGLFAASVVLFVIFVLVEAYYATEPVLPLELLTQRTPISVAINNLSLVMMVYGTMYTVPLYLTTVRLMTAAEAGKHLIPNSFFGPTGSLLAGLLVRHTGRYYWFTALGGCFAVISSSLLSTWNTGTPEYMLWTNLCPQSLAAGSVTTFTIVGLIADIGRDHVAVATGLSYVFRTIGQVLGVSLSGALTQTILQKELQRRITGEGAGDIIASIRKSSASIRLLPPDLQLSAVQSYQKAFHGVFSVSIVFAVVALLAGLGLKEVDLQGISGRQKVSEGPTGRAGASVGDEE